MSYTAVEICAVAALVLAVILALVAVDLNEEITAVRQTLDSLKSKADREEHERWRARRDAEDAAELEREFPNMAALGLLPHQPLGKVRLAKAENEQMAAAERERLAANEEKHQTTEKKE